MLLAGGDTLRLDAATYSRAAAGAATTRFVVDSDGFVYATNSGGTLTQRYAWCLPASSANKYDIQWSAVTNLPDVSPAAQNTSVNLGTDREWSETNNVTLETTTFQCRIYPAGLSTPALVSANITLEADGTP